MKKLDLTVIICTVGRSSVINTIKSIDVNCEILVVVNGPGEKTDKTMSLLNRYTVSNDREIRIVRLYESCLSKARNVGAINASYNKIVYYDDDTVIVQGALEKYSEMLEKFLLVGGGIYFRKDTFQSKMIGVTRDIGLPGYVLHPFGLNKKILDQIGGYFFDEDIGSAEDTELNRRAMLAGIKPFFIESLTCIHDNLTFKKDLSSAFWYGCGVRNQYYKKLRQDMGTNWDLLPTIAKKSILAAIYYVLWNCVYCLGYCTKKDERRLSKEGGA